MMHLVNYSFIAAVACCPAMSFAQERDTIPEGQLAWQDFSTDKAARWKEWSYSESRWWGADFFSISQ